MLLPFSPQTPWPTANYKSPPGLQWVFDPRGSSVFPPRGDYSWLRIARKQKHYTTTEYYIFLTVARKLAGVHMCECGAQLPCEKWWSIICFETDQILNSLRRKSHSRMKDKENPATKPSTSELPVFSWKKFSWSLKLYSTVLAVISKISMTILRRNI